MVSIKRILKHVPAVGTHIRVLETERQKLEAKIKVEDEIRTRTTEARTRILTILPQDYALMKGREITDYDPTGVSAFSPDGIEGSDGEIYARNYATIALLHEMDSMGIEATVATHYETITKGVGSIGNPHRYRVAVYGTGMKLKEQSH